MSGSLLSASGRSATLPIAGRSVPRKGPGGSRRVRRARLQPQTCRQRGRDFSTVMLWARDDACLPRTALVVPGLGIEAREVEQAMARVKRSVRACLLGKPRDYPSVQDAILRYLLGM